MESQADEHRTPAWRGAQQAVVRSIDRWIPSEHPEGSDARRRLRLVGGFIGLVLLLLPFPAVQHLIEGKQAEVLVIGIAWIFTALQALGLRRGMSSSVVGNGTTATLLVLVVVNAWLLGGIHSPPAIGLIVVPVSHAILVRGWSNWIWCGLAIGGAVLLDSVTLGSAVVAHEKTLALICLTVILTAVMWLYESSRLETIERLERARMQAEAAAEAKSRFLANMSHEIRTPLNGVLGMLGILQETPLNKDQHDFARTAHSSGVMLLDLINDILDFSKIEAGQMLLEATPFDLRGLSEDVLDQVAVLADGKGIELVSRYVPLTPTHVLGDPGRIRQILLNLVNNAVKFTEDGHVLLTVEEVAREGDTATLRCSVEDTGIGIPEDEQARVFEHFAQVDGSPSRQQGGTGLGLAIVRELTAMMEGRVGLSSTPGKGSTFWVELPLRVAKATAETHPEALIGLKLLVVDDNRVNRWVLKEQLGRWKFRLEEAASGPRALELLREAASKGIPFDIALLDYHMPRMDGLELTQKIKADETIRNTLLVMLSSVTSRADTKKLLDAGCAAYLIKPVHQSDLMNTLANVWDEEGPIPEAMPEEMPDLSISVARGRRILVVEDNAVNQKVATRMLRDLGAHVDVAGDGIEAVSQVEAFPYDLVFMDVQMPRMDGLEATRQIREQETLRSERVPIVAMTAHALAEDRERCLTAGMDGYVAKPISRRDLIRSLRDHLEDVDTPSPRKTIAERVTARQAETADKDAPRSRLSIAMRVTAPNPGDSDAPRAPLPISQRVTAPNPGEGDVPRSRQAIAQRMTAPNPNQPCDLQWLRSNYDADDQVIQELLGLFMNRTADLLREMAGSQPGEPAFDKGAHALKGLCGTVRARRMYGLLDTTPPEVAERLSELMSAYGELREYLSEQLDMSSPSLDVSLDEAEAVTASSLP